MVLLLFTDPDVDCCPRNGSVRKPNKDRRRCALAIECFERFRYRLSNICRSIMDLERDQACVEALALAICPSGNEQGLGIEAAKVRRLSALLRHVQLVFDFELIAIIDQTNFDLWRVWHRRESCTWTIHPRSPKWSPSPPSITVVMVSKSAITSALLSATSPLSLKPQFSVDDQIRSVVIVYLD